MSYNDTKRLFDLESEQNRRFVVQHMRNSGIKIDNEPHSHRCISIEMITDGSCEQTLNGVKYQCNRGMIFLMSPIDLHAFNIKKKIVSSGVYFHDAFVSPSLLDIFRGQNKPIMATLSGKTFQNVLREFAIIDEEYNKNGDIGNETVRGAITRIVIYILRTMKNDVPQTLKIKSGEIDKVITYMRYHIASDLSVGRLADMLHMSPNYFSEYFKSNTGKTFSDYLSSLRFDYAFNLIKATDLPIYKIGEMVGLSGTTHFTRMFTRYFGQSPTYYRREHTGGNKLSKA